MVSLGKLVDYLLPATCSLCGDRTADTPSLCAGCAASLPRNNGACARCGEPASWGRLCPACLSKPPPFSSTISPFVYAGPIRALVVTAKFRGDLGAVTCLGHLLACHVALVADAMPDMMVPVPLHPRRMRERGYNQALEMGKIIASRLAVRLETRLCRRIVPTAAQSALGSHAERRRNVRGAFRVGELPSGVRHIALLDDVMTSGATLEALALPLVDNGISRIDLWVVARAAYSNKRFIIK